VPSLPGRLANCLGRILGRVRMRSGTSEGFRAVMDKYQSQLGFKSQFEHIWQFDLKYSDSVWNSAIWLAIWFETISRVYQTKFLGVLIQSNLKWNEHISAIANKISKVIGIINKIKHTLSTDHLKLLWTLSKLLLYCMGCPQKNTSLTTLYKLQKRSVRVILLRSYRDHSEPLFRELKLLSIYQLCLKQILIFVYKSLNCLLPCHCTNYSTETSLHSHATRGHETNLYLAKAL